MYLSVCLSIYLHLSKNIKNNNIFLQKEEEEEEWWLFQYLL